MSAGGANGYANFDEHERHGRLYTGGKVAASHDGAIIVCMCGEELKLVDVVTGTVVGTVSSEGDEFTSFVMHPTKLELITASRTRQIRHTSLALAPGKCEIVRTWKAHKMPITTMAYDSSGQLLATGSTDQSVMVFNVAKGFCTHVFREHEGVVHRVVFHPDATKLQLFSSSHDNSIRVWDLRTKRCLARLASHVGVPAALAFSPDGATLLSGGRDQLINIWRLADYSCTGSMAVLEAVEDIHVLPPPAAAPRKKGAPPGPPQEAPLHFVTAGESGLLACWDAHSRSCVRRQPKPEGGLVLAEGGEGAMPGLTQLMRCGDALLATTVDQNLLFFGAADLAQRRTVVGYNDEITDVKYVGVAAEGEEAGSSEGAGPQQLAVATNSEQARSAPPTRPAAHPPSCLPAHPPTRLPACPPHSPFSLTQPTPHKDPALSPAGAPLLTPRHVVPAARRPPRRGPLSRCEL